MIQKAICLPALRTIYFESHLWETIAPEIWQKAHFSFNDSLVHFSSENAKASIPVFREEVKTLGKSERKTAKPKVQQKTKPKKFGEGDPPHAPKGLIFVFSSVRCLPPSHQW